MSSTPAPLRVAVMMTTRDRHDDLVRTCAALERLQPPPVEILITSDGCTDGTPDFLQKLTAPYRIFLNKHPRGSIPNRDAMMRAANADVILSLDDDSYPLEADAIARLQQLFAEQLKLAVASFPQRTDEFPDSMAQTDFGPPMLVGTYASSAAALRRSAFLELGGYETAFSHAYEEPDYALRCHAGGYEVRFEPSLLVRHHYTGVQRNELRTHQLHARNELWSVLLRCPFPQMPAVAAFRVARQFMYACSRGWRWAVREPLWWWRSLPLLLPALSRRQPLSWRSYLSWMRLLRKPVPLP